MQLELISPPDELVVSVEDAKQHLRVDHDYDDTLILSLIVAGTEWLQNHTERQLCTATYKLSLDAFPRQCCDGKPPLLFELPRPPLQAVTAVSYVDVNGASQTLSTSLYRVGQSGVYFLRNMPSLAVREDAVRIQYTAGYGTAADVPEVLKVCIKLWVGEFFNRRENTVSGPVNELPLGLRRLADQYRLRGVK